MMRGLIALSRHSALARGVPFRSFCVLPSKITLTLEISEPDVIRVLHRLDEGNFKLKFAVKNDTSWPARVRNCCSENRLVHALVSVTTNAGVIALDRVSGQLDAQFIHNEANRSQYGKKGRESVSQRLVENLRDELQSHAKQMHERVSTELAEYFNPRTMHTFS